MKNVGLFAFSIFLVLGMRAPARGEDPNSFINSLGMKMILIPGGSFSMGSEDGEFDEKPVHSVTIRQAFYMSEYEVTNAQYEQFDPSHAEVDHRGLTHEPNEAVIFVSWEGANSFCAWLSEHEGQPYHLPTEAKWEYACRAGTTTEYYTGDLPPDANSQRNGWGLYHMHGGVEEWCYDWYGPYDSSEQVDSLGRGNGDFRVCRGGRSANRMGTVPDDRHWLIGLRVAMGQLPETEPLPAPPPQRYQLNVQQETPDDIAKGPDPNMPYFSGPRPFVKIPAELDGGPLFSKANHDPALTRCSNGDLLAIWYSGRSYSGREVAMAVSRLRYGHTEWEPASLFWDAPDRNDHAPALWLDESGKIYHFNGLAASSGWRALAVALRVSEDNGVTWSQDRLILPEHRREHQPVGGVFRSSWGSIILPCEAGSSSVLWISEDNGQHWYNPGGIISGIQAAVVELNDGRLLALARQTGSKSISYDRGESWTYSPSEFPHIDSGQRPVLLRLEEGPILFASFTQWEAITDAQGREQPGGGMFAALSYDEGRTWPVKKLVSPGGPAKNFYGHGSTGWFTLDDTHAEPAGYLAATQMPNRVIHLISSGLHYSFNLAWLRHGVFVVEDFESYEGDEDLAAFWSDWRMNHSNMVVGHDDTSDEGSRAMRCQYENDSPPYFSETEFFYDAPTNWALGCAREMEFCFHGGEENSVPGRMYITVADESGNEAMVEYGEPNDVTEESWHCWSIDLDRFAESGVDLSRVRKLGFGLADGGKGTVLVDDIRLLPTSCPIEYGVSGDLNGDGLVNFKDFSTVARVWGTNDVEGELYQDDTIDFKDLSILTNNWLRETLWP